MPYSSKYMISKTRLIGLAMAALLFIYAIGDINYPGSGIISALIFCLWFITALCIDRISIIRLLLNPGILSCILFCGCYVIFLPFEPNKYLAVKCLFNYIIYFAPAIIFLFYSNPKHEYEYLRLRKIVPAIFTLWCAWAVVFYIIHPSGARFMAENYMVYGYVAVGRGQFLAYAACIYFIFLFEKVLNRGRTAWGEMLTMLITLILVIQSESAITFLALICGCSLSIFICIVKKFYSNVLACISLFLIIIALIVFVFFYRQILEGLADMINNLEVQSKISIRINEVIRILLKESNSRLSSSTVRLQLYKQSFDIFKSHPITGEILNTGLVPGTGQAGNHSDFLDALARWGFLIGVPYLGMFINHFWTFVKKQRALSCVPTFIFMAILNPVISFQVTSVVLFILPVYSNIISIEKRNNYESKRELIEENKRKTD